MTIYPKKRIKGSITLLMVIILLPTMVFGGVIVDTSRMNMAKSLVSSSGDLAMNSTLANYDTVLKEVYGLFANSQNKTSEELNADVLRYFEETLVSYGAISEEDSDSYVQNLMGQITANLFNQGRTDASNFMNMDIIDFAVNPVEESSLANTDILKKQIVEYMKYRAPLQFSMGFFDSLKTFSSLTAQTDVVNKMVKSQENTQDVANACGDLIKKIRDYDKKVDEYELVSPYDANKKYPVWSAEGSKTDYSRLLKSFREDWPASYKTINRLVLAFNMKNPTTSDFYLYGHSSGFITENNGKYSVRSNAVNVTVNSGDKQQLLKNTISKLNSKNYKYSKAFNNKVFDNTGKKITDVQAAITQYDTFRANYPKMKEVLELLETARQCYNDTKSELDKAKTDKQNAANAKSSSNNAIRNCEDAVIATMDNMNNANSLSSTSNQAVQNVMNMRFNYSTMSENDDRIWLVKTRFEDNFKVNFDSYSPGSSNPYRDVLNNGDVTASEYNYLLSMSDCIDDIYINFSAIIEQQHNYNEAKSKEAEAQNKINELNSLINEYQAVLSKYKSSTDSYKTDNDDLKKYISASRATVSEMAKNIKDMFKKMRNNADELRKISVEISELTTAAITAMENYEKSVNAWEASNTSNKNVNPDSFVDINTADIETAKQEYNIDSAKTFKAKVDEKTKTLEAFVKQMDSNSKFLYAGEKISNMSSYNTVVAKVRSSGQASEKFYTQQQADDLFPKLYKAPTKYPYTKEEQGELGTAADKMTNLYRGKKFIGNGLYGNSSFLAYLNATFPEDKGSVTEKEKKSEDEYKNMKNNTEESNAEPVVKDSAGSSGGATGVDAFGYSFKSITLSDAVKKALPSKAGDSEKVDTGGKTVEKKDGKENVSSNMDNQTSIINSMFKKLTNLLTEVRDDVFVMEYIMGNFSHNASVQELLVEKEQETASILKEISAHAKLNDYKGQAKTLSRYPFSKENNYIYGSEIEYILYGNREDISKNVTSAKATIYAIRFVLNAIYAFTNAEIRNYTRSFGLMVQAATMGFVPYQIVMVVAQLALAAAESALDLKMLSNGMPVAVVKTSETWLLSPTGAANALKEGAVDYLANGIEWAISTAVESINSTITNLVDTTAENLEDTKTSLVTDLRTATKEKGRELLNVAFAEFESTYTKAVNDLQYKEFETKQAAKAAVTATFKGLKNKVGDFGKDMEVHQDIKDALLVGAQKEMKKMLGDIEAKINSKIDSIANVENISLDIAEVTKDAKKELTEKIEKYVDGVYKNMDMYLGRVINDVAKKVNGVVATTTEEAKEKLCEQTNSILNDYLGDNSTVGEGIKGSSNNYTKNNKTSVANMIKFKYSDYLRLFLFVNLCANPEGTLSRTADVIQMNISQAGSGSHLKHAANSKDGGFLMKNAYTYLSVEANLKTDMLFLNLDLFKTQLESYGGIVEVDSSGFGLDNFTKIKYKGLYGY